MDTGAGGSGGAGRAGVGAGVHAAAGRSGLLERGRPARFGTEVRGGLAAGRRAPGVGEGPPRRRRLDESADPVGAAALGPPRLRNRRSLPQGRAVAAGPAVAHGARALLRPGARELRPDLLVGNLAARARRSDRPRRPEGLDARADLRRSRPRLRRALEGAPGSRRREGRGAGGVRRAERLPARDPRHAPRRGQLLLRGDARRHLRLEPRPGQRGLHARPAGIAARGCDVDGFGEARRSRLASRHAPGRRARGPRGLARRPRRARGRLRGPARAGTSAERRVPGVGRPRSDRGRPVGAVAGDESPALVRHGAGAAGGAAAGGVASRPARPGARCGPDGAGVVPGFRGRPALSGDRQEHRGPGLPVAGDEERRSRPPVDPGEPPERREAGVPCLCDRPSGPSRFRKGPPRHPAAGQGAGTHSRRPPGCRVAGRATGHSGLPRPPDVRRSADEGPGLLRRRGVGRFELRLRPGVPGRGGRVSPFGSRPGRDAGPPDGPGPRASASTCWRCPDRPAARSGAWPSPS